MGVFASPLDAIVSVLVLGAAGISEVGGGWCIWKWKREGWHWALCLVGACALFASGIIPTYQKQQFSRTFAVYGSFFVVLSFLWGWALDKVQPDLWDCIGSLVIIVGAVLIMFVPRKAQIQSNISADLP